LNRVNHVQENKWIGSGQETDDEDKHNTAKSDARPCADRPQAAAILDIDTFPLSSPPHSLSFTVR
jgi:hypothetical protein